MYDVTVSFDWFSREELFYIRQRGLKVFQEFLSFNSPAIEPNALFEFWRQKFNVVAFPTESSINKQFVPIVKFDRVPWIVTNRVVGIERLFPPKLRHLFNFILHNCFLRREFTGPKVASFF